VIICYEWSVKRWRRGVLCLVAWYHFDPERSIFRCRNTVAAVIVTSIESKSYADSIDAVSRVVTDVPTSGVDSVGGGGDGEKIPAWHTDGNWERSLTATLIS
jgi:hypothetical protein